DHGEYAVTHFAVEEVLADTTLVRVKLDTGRRNQIRVHLSEAGHPIIGDRRYRPNLTKHPDWLHTRLALHAHVLGFQHPVNGKDLRFVSPMPRSFQIFIRRQRRATKSESSGQSSSALQPPRPKLPVRNSAVVRVEHSTRTPPRRKKRVPPKRK
ncbi:MAG TPA: hypothetical protein VK137_00590, partial [Planctomycetaceae bacterium]|nr:hypothetical protein [Planctomycetaceae bacterium]